jgi:hypothetical protein
MRSTEEPGYVPGARIPINPPADGVYNGWHFEWVRYNTLIEYYENERIKQAAESGEFSLEVLGLPENEFPLGTYVAPEYVWDGGEPNQFFTGYSTEDAPGGWASWNNVAVPDELYSPETRENTPGVYGSWHYSLRRFTSYFTVNCHVNIDYAYLESSYPPDEGGEYRFPLNDSVFIFVNGKLAFWSSTDINGSETTPPSRRVFYNVQGSPLKDDDVVVITDGWYIPIAGPEHRGDIAPLLREGKNVIDVIADDFYVGGGMSDLRLVILSAAGRAEYKSGEPVIWS